MCDVHKKKECSSVVYWFVQLTKSILEGCHGIAEYDAAPDLCRM